MILSMIVSMLLLGLAVAQNPDSWALPGEQVYPEGIAIDDGVFYVGSTIDGTIFRGDIETGDVEVFAEGSQQTAIGMAVANDGALWVAGGSTGNVYRYDLTTGTLIGVYTTPPASDVFLNDIAIGPDGTVYVTDSQRPVLFVVPPTAEPGDMDAAIRFEGSPVRYREGFNLNGIVITDDGASLIVVQSNTGMLFRIGTADGSIHAIEVDADLTNGDGLVLDGDMLYVVRNRQEEIVPVELSEDMASGTSREPITSDALKFPTTAALADGSLLVVNSQFGAQGTDDVELPFSVVRVALPD